MTGLPAARTGVCGAVEPGDTRSATITRPGVAGWDRGPCRLLVVGLEHILKKLDEGRLAGVSLIGLQDYMFFIGSAKTLHRNWRELKHALAEAGHRLRSHKCGVWAPGYEQFVDENLPRTVRDLCAKVPRGRQEIRLLGSSANAQYTTDVRAKGLKTLEVVEQLACHQHHHVSFAQAWIALRRGFAFAMKYDFSTVRPPITTPSDAESQTTPCGHVHVESTDLLSWRRYAHMKRHVHVSWFP